MSDNYPDGIPPITGLRPQGSSMPPENVHLPAISGSSNDPPASQEMLPSSFDLPVTIGSPDDPLASLSFEEWKARDFRATSPKIELPAWVTRPWSPPRPLENPYVVGQEPRRDSSLDHQASSFEPQDMNIPQTTGFNDPGPVRLSLQYPPPGLPNPYAVNQVTQNGQPGPSPAHRGPFLGPSEHPNPYAAPGFPSHLSPPGAWPYAPGNDHPGPSAAHHGPVSGPFEHTNAYAARDSTSQYPTPAGAWAYAPRNDHPGPSPAYRGPFLGPSEHPNPYAAPGFPSHPSPPGALPYAPHGMNTPQTSPFDHCGPVHPGLASHPSGLPNSLATFGPPSQSPIPAGVYLPRAHGTDSRWMPTFDHPGVARNRQFLPDEMPREFDATRASLNRRHAFTLPSRDQHVLDIQQIASVGRPDPDYPQPDHTARNLAPSSPGIRSNRPGQTRGVTAPETQLERRVSRAPNQFENSARFYLVKGIDTDIEGWSVLKVLELFTSTIGPVLTELNTKGQFHVGFEDLDEAAQAVGLFSNFPDWLVLSLSKQQFNQQTMMAFPMPQELGDTVFVTLYCGPQTDVVSSNAKRHARDFLALIGPVRSICNVTTRVVDEISVVRYYELEVRYHMERSAYNAIKALNGVRRDGLIIEVMPRADDTHFTTTTKARCEFEKTTLAKESGRRPPKTPAYRGKGRRPQATFHGHRGGERSNVISMGEIPFGNDDRTAVMCRNIPHVMAWRELKAILDLSSAGRYNYLYLRINFGADLNVGYAFINFVTPADVAVFVRARAGRTWPGFEQFTGKIAEITYADVQGFGTLVERFRNIVPHQWTQGRGEAVFPQVNNFYTLSLGVHRSQEEAGLHPGGASPQATRRGARRAPAPRQAAPAEDDQAN
ncbi:uncharacterized protein N7496_010964 [Penicillium cataractarum]|uniref:Mei2-like C-terminal RNA recognition motif domain-containing protein n=1 Tax=Penicillium cataractarum TaxID=2100454 RepID=A0A9W9RED2_9EURO|nr:uncharacterized protein N7496_010964 [Penicillium cataractarum]KAJ5358551.1 hypothetical protein N7496_010964 [Penicillium cataractarum]